jgi:hypothetical protein
LTESDAFFKQLGYESHQDVMESIKSVYPTYTFDDLLRHKGIILFPYCASVMSFFEYYRLSIPIFVPSLQFLTDLEIRYRTSSQRIYNGFHAPYPFLPYSPNDPNNPAAIRYWLNFSDFYVMPHVIQFHSAEHLANLLLSLTDEDLIKISNDMMDYSEKVRKDFVEVWTNRFTHWGIGRHKRQIPVSYEREMMSRWSLFVTPETLPSQPWPWTSCGGNNPGFGGKCGDPLNV